MTSVSGVASQTLSVHRDEHADRATQTTATAHDGVKSISDALR